MSDWRFSFPNAADHNFNFFHLLEQTKQSGLARARRDLRVAIVGAGAAGLTVARELVRAGIQGVSIYEASERIGGRLWSKPVPRQQHTTYELGAMRIPTFTSDPEERRFSAFGHYQALFEIESLPFPNPGTTAAKVTGIFLKDGRGPTGKGAPGRLILWKPEKDGDPPDDATLKKVHEKWDAFATRFKDGCRDAYNAGGQTWTDYWHKVASHYWHRDFADLVFLDPQNDKEAGNFGGLGMKEEEARLFYVIGAGDGGWGAFFNVSCLYVIRTLIFGFGSGHQLITGIIDGTRPSVDASLRSDNHHALRQPRFLGVQSFAEAMFYGGSPSVYEAAQLFTRAPVRRLTRNDGDGTIELLADGAPGGIYDAVVLTCPSWSLQLNVEFEGFEPEHLPYEVRHSLATSHWITSCKVFVPLNKPLDPKKIPPLLMTDRFIQGMYAYAVGDDPGVLLISYTWEDDATKLLSIADDDTLTRRCLDELIEVLATCGIDNLGDYVDIDHIDESCVIRWSRQPTYAGCAKLYRERMWNENQALLSYNQELSADSGLYFAGDAFTLESGWVEAALRSALDATIHLLRDNKADMCFDVAHYPSRERYNIEEPPALD